MKISDKQIKKILELTAYIDPRDKSIWGYDTECGNFEDYKNKVREILEGGN
jgi:hypothetical protein